jgi:hypothetical protein
MQFNCVQAERTLAVSTGLRTVSRSFRSMSCIAALAFVAGCGFGMDSEGAPPSATVSIEAEVSALSGNEATSVVETAAASLAQVASAGGGKPSAAAPVGVVGAPAATTTSASASAPLLASSDPRTIWWVDPRRGWANQVPGNSLFKEVSGPNGPARDIAEPGIIGANGDMTLSRTADPSDSSRMAFRHRLSKDFPLHPNRASRSLLTQSWQSDGTEVKRDVEYWAGYSVRLEADAVNGGPGLGLLGFHSVPSPWREGYVSPVGMSFWSNGAGQPSRFQFIANWAYVPIDPLNGVSAQRRDLGSYPAKPGVWYDFVYNFKIGTSVDAGLWRIWVRERGTNNVQQIVNYSGPLGYGQYNEDKYPQTFGLYSWDVPWAGQSPTSTSYTKGLYIFRAASGTPAVNLDSVMALLRSI